MILLFLSDIDGCLSEPFAPFDLPALGRLARLTVVAGAVGETTAPALSVLSGRAYPYVEAVSQLLGTAAPVFFEAGAGAFYRAAGEVRWHPAFTAEADGLLDHARAWLRRDLLPGTPLAYDFGKRTQAGVSGPDPAAVARAADRVRRFVADEAPGLVAFATPVSVDVVVRGLTKGETLPWIAALTGAATAETAFIGDTEGDVGALRAVGLGFAPANAAPEALAAAAVVTRAPGVRGVIEAYRRCLGQRTREPGARAVVR